MREPGFFVRKCCPCPQALDNGRKRIREECATLGTAESWEPLDLKKDQPKLSGKGKGKALVPPCHQHLSKFQLCHMVVVV